MQYAILKPRKTRKEVQEEDIILDDAFCDLQIHFLQRKLNEIIFDLNFSAIEFLFSSQFCDIVVGCDK